MAGDVLLSLALYPCDPVEKTPGYMFPLTFLASWHIAAPGEIPLAHEDLRADQLISRVALVGDNRAVD